MMEDNKIFKTNEISIEISPVGKAIQSKDIQYFSYDENSGLQLIHILMDGKPLDLPNGTEIRLSAVKLNNQNQKLIYTPEIVDPLKGIVSFVIPREFLGYRGQIRCGLYINLSNNQTMHVGYFYINMGVSDIDTNLTEFTEDFWQGWSEFEAGSTAKMKELEAALDGEAQRLNEHANQKITEYDQYIASGKSDWEEFVEQNREIIESVDPGGIVLTELIDSRVTLDGTSFPRLSERLFVVDEANEFNQLLTNQLGLVNGIEVVGHRGMGGLYPEGTIPAFRNSILRGHADSIEFDIRSSVDDELYILHDTTVDRTTNGTGSIASLTSTYLNSLDAGSKFSPIYEGAQLPTLDNALKQIQGLPFTRLYPQTNVGEIADETQRKELFSKTYNLFKKYGLLSRTTLAFPHLNLLQEYRSLAPDVRFMLMCGSQTSIVQGAYDQAITDKNCSIGADVAFWINNPTWGAKCKNAGIEPIAWSVRIDHLEPLRKVGVNVMITDEDLKGVFF